MNIVRFACQFLTMFFALSVAKAQSLPEKVEQPLLTLSTEKVRSNSSQATTDLTDLIGRYPPNSIRTAELANQAITDVTRERHAIEAEWTANERTCMSSFFVTHCLDNARERRRVALASLRPIELEANALKRKVTAAQRDQALNEKKTTFDQSTPPGRQDRPSLDNGPALTVPDGSIAREGALPARTQDAARTISTKQPAKNRKILKSHKKSGSTFIDPETEARNQSAFDKKALESAQRQRDIAEKNAEKERDRARRRKIASDAVKVP
jgi:colicin import membrane protein